LEHFWGILEEPECSIAVMAKETAYTLGCMAVVYNEFRFVMSSH